MDDHTTRLAATRRAIFGSGPVTAIGQGLIRSVDFQEAVTNTDDPDTLVMRIHRTRRCSDGAELALYRHYVVMIDSIGMRFGRYPAFGQDDGHQEGVLALLEMARNGAEDFNRRVKRAITYRVATEVFSSWSDRVGA